MNALSPFVASDRRKFLKHFALSTAVSIFGGKLWKGSVLADVDPYGQPVARIQIKISDYPALENQFGSVRFAFAHPLDPYNGPYPFALSNAGEGVFYAVDTRCSHQGCPVEAFDGAAFAMVCYCHGSEYDIMGKVTRGPAVNDLWQYQATFDGVDTVTVVIPGIDMTIRNVQVQEKTGDTVRFRLDFPTIDTGYYRVFFRPDFDVAPVEIPFSTTPTGAATETQLTGNGGIKAVYVDATLPKGFFSVALIVEPG
jgi:Rieske Fe-S protein